MPSKPVRRFHLIVVAVLLMPFLGGFVAAAITVPAPTNLTAMLVVPPDGDTVTLDPNGVTYVGTAPAFYRNAVSGDFGAPWVFNFNGADNSLNGTLRISHYQARSNGPHNGAGRLFASYERAAGDPPLANLRFLQVVNTTDPLGGAGNPYTDPRPNDDTRPFYWTDAEVIGERNAGGGPGGNGTLAFRDTSSRPCGTHPDTIDWRGTLLLADDSAGAMNINVYDGIEWGWDFVCQAPPARHRAPVRVVDDKLPPEQGVFEFDGQRSYELDFGSPLGVQEVIVHDLQLSEINNVQVLPSGDDEIQQFEALMSGVFDIPAADLFGVPLSLSGILQTIAYGKAGESTGSWDTELISMELTGTVATVLGTVQLGLRNSPDPLLPSLGDASVSAFIQSGKAPDDLMGDGTFLIDSFFDVFTEISIDGGLSWSTDDNGPAAMNLVPEPGTGVLMATGLLACLLRRRGRKGCVRNG